MTSISSCVSKYTYNIHTYRALVRGVARATPLFDNLLSKVGKFREKKYKSLLMVASYPSFEILPRAL